MRTSTLSRLTLQKAFEGRASCKRYPSWRLGSQLSAWSRLRGSPVSCTHGSHPVLSPPFLGATWRRGPHASLDLLLCQPQYTLPLGGKTFKFTGNILLRSVFCSAFSLSLRVFQQGKKKNHTSHFQWPCDIQAEPTPHAFTERPPQAGPVAGTGSPQGPAVCALSSGPERSTLTSPDSEHHGRREAARATPHLRRMRRQRAGARDRRALPGPRIAAPSPGLSSGDSALPVTAEGCASVFARLPQSSKSNRSVRDFKV